MEASSLIVLRTATNPLNYFAASVVGKWTAATRPHLQADSGCFDDQMDNCYLGVFMQLCCDYIFRWFRSSVTQPKGIQFQRTRGTVISVVSALAM